MIGAVAPVFALILLGFGLRRLGFPGDDFWPHCERLVYYLLFPALLVTRLAVVPLQAEPLADLALALVLPTLGVSAGLLLLRPLTGLSAAGFTSVFQGGIRFNTYIALALGAALDPGRGLELTALEFELLYTLARHAGQVLSREQLLQQVWGYDYVGDLRVVDAAIKRLRAKLRQALPETDLISTVRGVGYKLLA